MMHESKKPLWLDGAMFFVSLCLLGYTITGARATCLSR